MQAEVERILRSAPTLLDVALRDPERAKQINGRVADLRSEYATEEPDRVNDGGMRAPPRLGD
jgi:hypothetical protein